MEGFLKWLIVLGVMVFLATFATTAGFFRYAYNADASYIVVLIAILVVFATFKCGLDAFVISVEGEGLKAIQAKTKPPKGSLIGNSFTTTKQIEEYLGNLASRLDTGWFLADIMLKLGLAGTVIGFVIMLSSVADIQDGDINTVQDVLLNMSLGMGTALFTTLSGLVGNGVTSSQYYMLDKSLDSMKRSLKSHQTQQGK